MSQALLRRPRSSGLSSQARVHSEDKGPGLGSIAGTSKRTALVSEGGCDEEVLEPWSEFPFHCGPLIHASWKGTDLFFPACVLLTLVFITFSRGS